MALTTQLTEIHDFTSNIAGLRERVVAVDYFDKVIFAHPNSELLFWSEGMSKADIVPGLTSSDTFWGVNVFEGHLIVWSGDRLKWNSQNDYALWIPVGETAVSFVLKTLKPFTKTDYGVESDWIYVDRSIMGMIPGQFVSIDNPPKVSYFEVVRVAPSTDQEPVLSGTQQSLQPGATGPVFISETVKYEKGTQLQFEDVDVVLVVTRAPDSLLTGAEYVAEDFNVPDVGGTVPVKLTGLPVFTEGTYVSIGSTSYPGQDVYLVEAVDYLNKSTTLKRMGVASATRATHYAGETIVAQPYVTVENTSFITAVSAPLKKLKELHAFTVKPLDLTNEDAVGHVYPVGTNIISLDANSAGELSNTGSGASGVIYRVDTLGSYGYIFKSRSIQSMQYVGADQGTFYIRPEITNEGFIGRYSFVKVGLDKMYFWGNREIYQYSGGNQLIPIAQQHSKQLFSELDKSRTDEIIGFHNESSSEIWFIYPMQGRSKTAPSRVFVYNYLENSCSIDDYEGDGITAVGSFEWVLGLHWVDALGQWNNPGSWGADASWSDLAEGRGDSLSTLAFEKHKGEPTLTIYGENYDRDGEAYESVHESPDYDNQDPLAWKYADTVEISFQVKVPTTGDEIVEIQIGSRDNFDNAVTWSPAKEVLVQGGGNYTTKINVQRSGRFLRVRFRSKQVGIRWRVSQFKLMGRVGSTY